MALQYTYVKERRQFGRKYKLFLRSEVLANYPPVKSESKKFLTKWTADKTTEERCQFAEASISTENSEYVSRGMCHIEGGYAKEIDIDDEEQTLRYKKKLQRSEEYRTEMTRNLDSMKKAVMQNASVNIYENYFDGDCANVLQCYRHPNEEVVCPATKVSFSIEQSPKMAVAYSHSDYLQQEENPTCPLLWDMTSSECLELKCQSSCTTLAYHKKYSNIISGGLQNGKVCVWDVRNAVEPSLIGDKSHQGFVSCLRWSHKNNFEMVTGSSNGEIFWWDIRKMNESPSEFRIETVETDKKDPVSGNTVDSLRNAESNIHRKNAVDFDRTSSKNIRIGTGDGRVIVAQKKGDKLEKMYETKCHEGLVSTVAQNWASYKCILTLDSCDIKVWAEDMQADPIFAVSSIENEFSCGAWSLTRYSRFFIGKIDGSIQLWDLTFNHHDPYFTIKPTCSRVNDIQTNNNGTLMAGCYNNGDVYAFELLDSVAGTIRDVKVQELNFGAEESD